MNDMLALRMHSTKELQFLKDFVIRLPFGTYLRKSLRFPDPLILYSFAYMQIRGPRTVAYLVAVV